MIKLWIVAILLIIAIGMDQHMPMAPSSCDQYAQGHKGEDAPYYDCAALDRFVLQPVMDGLWVIGAFTDSRHDAIIATGTLVIAGFTGTLWWVTWGMVRIAKQEREDALRAVRAAEQAATAAQATVEAMREIDTRQAADFRASLAASQKAADAADLSAKAAIGVELANLHVLQVAAIGNLEEPDKWITNFMPRMVIRNYGRTPAFGVEIVTNKQVASDLSMTPKYVEYTQFPTRTAIPPGVDHMHTDPSLAVRHIFTQEELRTYLDGSANLFVYGVIRFRDFLGMYWEKGFIFSARVGSRDFFDAGRIYPQYDYHKIDAEPHR